MLYSSCVVTLLQLKNPRSAIRTALKNRNSNTMHDDSRNRLISQFAELTEYLNRELHHGVLFEWSGINLTIPQVRTLVLLDRRGSMRMGKISECLGSTVSATTSIVERMVTKGLVERDWDPDDRRVVLCKLTPAGRGALRDLWRLQEDLARRVANRLNTDQLEQLVQSLQIVSDNVQDARAPISSDGSN